MKSSVPSRPKFRDTKFGRILFDKVPQAAAVIGDVLPDNGVLGIAKNLIDNATLTDTERAELQAELQSYQLAMFEQEEKSRERASGIYHMSKDFTDRLANHIIRWNLWFVLALLVLNSLIYYVGTRFDFDQTALMITTNIITFIIRGLLDERKDVTGFYLGGSFNKNKDDND